MPDRATDHRTPASAGRWVPAVGLVALCLAAYGRILGFGIAEPDVYTLIRTTRLDGIDGLVHLFTTPLMDGTVFTDLALFYRPVTSLSFTIDHAIWGLTPLGYHLTDLLLHTGVVVLAYVFAHRVTGRRSAAWFGAALFAVHPITMDSVPAISKRQDVLATLILLGALLLFARHLEHGGRWWLAGSLVALVAAMGAKEIAVVGLPLVPLYAWFAQAHPGETLVEQARAALRRSWAHLAAGAGFLAWRSWVLGGLGGYNSIWIYKWTSGPLEAAVATLTKTLAYLVYPATMLAERLGVPLRTMLALEVGAMGLVLVAAYLAARPVGGLTDQAAGLSRWLTRTRQGRGVVVVSLFLLGTVCLVSVTFAHGPRNMYLPALPFSLLVGWGLVAAAGRLRASQGTGGHGGARRDRGLDRVSRLGAVGLGVLAVSLTVTGPLMQTGLGEWEAQGVYNERFLAAFDESLEEVEPGAKVWITGYAGGFTEPRGRWSHALHVGNLVEHSVTSWLVLHGRGDAVDQVIIEHPVTLDRVPDEVTIHVETPGNGTTVMRVDNGDATRVDA